MERGSLWYGLILVYAVIIVLVQTALQFGFFTLSERMGSGVQLLFTFLTPVVAIVAGIVVLSYFGMKTTQSKGILFLVGALVLWLVADIIWQLGGNAISSLADYFYFAGYILIFVSTIFGILTVKSDFFRSSKLLSLFIGVLVVAGLLYVLFPLGWDAEAPFMSNLVVAGYVAIDYLIIASVLFLVVLAFTGTFSRPWIVIGAGLCFTAVADMIYALNTEVYDAGGLPWIDICWYASYLLFAVAFILMRQKTEELLAKT